MVLSQLFLSFAVVCQQEISVYIFCFLKHYLVFVLYYNFWQITNLFSLCYFNSNSGKLKFRNILWNLNWICPNKQWVVFEPIQLKFQLMKWKRANSLHSEICPTLFHKKEMAWWKERSEKDRNLQTRILSELLLYLPVYGSIFGHFDQQEKKIVTPILLPNFLGIVLSTEHFVKIVEFIDFIQIYFGL